jgi:hypothetical protein
LEGFGLLCIYCGGQSLLLIYHHSTKSVASATPLHEG